MTIPKIVSVDDHVVEPAHVNGRAGSRRSTGRTGRESSASGGRRSSTSREEIHQHRGSRRWVGRRLDLRGPPHLRAQEVRRVRSTTPDGTVDSFDRTVMTMTAVTSMRSAARLLRSAARIKDFELNWVDGSLPSRPSRASAGRPSSRRTTRTSRSCVRLQRWMVRRVRTLGWDEHPALPHAAVGRRPGGGGDRPNAAPFARSASASCQTRQTSRASTGYWTVLSVCNDTGVTLCMHIPGRRRPPASPDAPEAWGMLAFNNSVASLGDWLFSGKLITFPSSSYLLPRARSAGSYALGRPTTVWGSTARGSTRRRSCPSRRPPTTTAASSAASPPTGRAQQPRDRRRRQHLLRDRPPTHRHDVAELQGMRGEDGRRRRPRRRDGVRGAAQRSSCWSSTASDPHRSASGAHPCCLLEGSNQLGVHVLGSGIGIGYPYVGQHVGDASFDEGRQAFHGRPEVERSVGLPQQ